jgi:pimeloyl-ACP methyl ester carboxylesterase
MRKLWVCNAKNRRIRVHDHGDPFDPRPAILGLPGYARNGKDFTHLAARLAPRRLVTLDYRGRGDSDHELDWRAYAPASLIDDIRHVAIATGLHKVVVVGTSLGGILAMGMGVALPTLLAGVVLNDVGPEVESNGADYITAYIGKDNPQPDWPSAVSELRRMLPTLSLKTEAEWLNFAQNTFREGADGELHVDWDPAIARPLLASAGQSVDLWPLFQSLRRLPVLGIRGGLSEILSEPVFQRMQAAHPAMNALTLEGVGHAPTLDEPTLRDALDRFLKNVDT